MDQSFLAVQRGFNHQKSLVIVRNVPDTGSTYTKYGMKDSSNTYTEFCRGYFLPSSPADESERLFWDQLF